MLLPQELADVGDAVAERGGHSTQLKGRAAAAPMSKYSYSPFWEGRSGKARLLRF